MKKSYLFAAALFISASTLVYVGCKKDKTDDTNNNPNPNTTTVGQTEKDNATSEAMSGDAFKQVDNASKMTPAAGGTKGTDTMVCATVTINPLAPNSWPKTLTIDFGPTNCTCIDGIQRRGKITAVLTGKYKDSLTVITITFNNYFVSDYKIEGTITVTNLGHSGTYGNGGNLKYKVEVVNFKVTIPDGSKYSLWNSTRTREWIAGESTQYPLWQDDEYLVEGTASGTDINGTSYTVNITKALYYAMNCQWIKSGTVEVTPQGVPTRIVDWGNGTCDNQASVTVSGYTINFTLP